MILDIKLKPTILRVSIAQGGQCDTSHDGPAMRRSTARVQGFPLRGTSDPERAWTSSCAGHPSLHRIKGETMFTPSRTSHRFLRASLLGALAMAFVSFTATAWTQPPSPTTGAPAANRTATGPGGAREEHDADQERVGIEAKETLLEAKRTLLRIDESRAEQAKRWRDYYEKMVREGRVTEDRAVAARDDLLMLQEHVGAERAELKVAEMRVRNARRRFEQGDRSPARGDQAREDAEILEAMLEAKRAVLRAGESRAEQARRAKEHYEGLFKRGMATEDQVLAASDDVLKMDAALAWGRAELKVTELRVKNARRLASQGTTTADGVGRRLAELEERLLGAEMKADLLQHEVGRLRRELPRETHGTR